MKISSKYLAIHEVYNYFTEIFKLNQSLLTSQKEHNTIIQDMSYITDFKKRTESNNRKVGSMTFPKVFTIHRM